jgi:hypothetical protein
MFNAAPSFSAQPRKAVRPEDLIPDLRADGPQEYREQTPDEMLFIARAVHARFVARVKRERKAAAVKAEQKVPQKKGKRVPRRP